MFRPLRARSTCTAAPCNASWQSRLQNWNKPENLNWFKLLLDQ
jgi:hypothetical protein